MSSPLTVSSADLTACAQEPIHIPGSIQPHGILLVLSGDLRVEQVSANCSSLLGKAPGEVIGRSLTDVLTNGASLARAIEAAASATEPICVQMLNLSTAAGTGLFRALLHRTGQGRILELEPADAERDVSFHELHPLVWTFLTQLQGLPSAELLTSYTAQEVRRITGFDRVMILRFDENWNGTVTGESRNERLPSYLGLCFPATDIPAQARELYRLNRIRLIPDAGYSPVPLVPPLHPGTNQPLDLTFSSLRSVSPYHVEYMRNMGTAASMSVSILVNGNLWGLISCHHATPHYAGFEVRAACDLMAQVYALQLGAREHVERYESRISRREIHSRLLEAMAQEEWFVDGLLSHSDELLRLANAQGAAILADSACHRIGSAPEEEDLRRLADWLAANETEDVWHTTELPPGILGGEFAESVTGVLAISISKFHRSYIFWFRPELRRTVSWGGDPRKPGAEAEDGRVSPRRSFELWQETVRGRSAPWQEWEIEAAANLRNSIVSIVLTSAEERAELTSELERSNQELEAFSYSVSHDLRAPFRHIVGYSELLRELEGDNLSETGRRYISTIIESAQFAGTLVDNLLMFSQIGRAKMTMVPIDMNVLIRESRKRLAPEIGDRPIRWELEDLPPCEGDPALLRLALLNLLSNAVKYTRTRDQALIAIGSQQTEKETIYFIRDNGVGFEMDYVHKLFGVFQRLHRMEDFEGTGIGLANVRRIIARHGGRTWAEGEPDRGATFYFALPRMRSNR